MSAQTSHWLAVDWGSSRLRAWHMNASEVQAHGHSDAGMASLAPGGFGPALLDLTDGWALPENAPIVACGMLGARQGWVEVPYRPVPCTPLGGSFGRTSLDGRPVHIVPGLSQTRTPDVMRGEETQIAGFMARNPGWDGVLCLPGTHTKWAEISAGEVVSFQTFMTGELFALLSQASVLRHSIGAAEDDWDAGSFASAVSDAMARPERLAAELFALRARDLLEGTAPAAGRARLSGLFIGAELAAARPYWLGQQIAVIGAQDHATLYAGALQAQGVPVALSDGDHMVRAGLTTAWRSLKGT